MKVKTLRGPWQEIELRVHSLEEIDHKQFWNFFEQAVAGFKQITERVQQDPESSCPGRCWAANGIYSAKAFRPAKRISWEAEVLEELLRNARRRAPKGKRCGTIARSSV